MPLRLSLKSSWVCVPFQRKKKLGQVIGVFFSQVKIDKSVPSYKIGFWSDDAEKCRAVNELIRTDIEEMNVVRLRILLVTM